MRALGHLNSNSAAVSSHIAPSHGGAAAARGTRGRAGRCLLVPGVRWWAVQEGGCGRWCVVPVMSFSLWCDLPDSGSPPTGGSSCPPVMTRPSSCGTRPAGSACTRTASTAGEPPPCLRESSHLRHPLAPAFLVAGRFSPSLPVRGKLNPLGWALPQGTSFSGTLFSLLLRTLTSLKAVEPAPPKRVGVMPAVVAV